jgi:hypothetical protein
LSAIVVHGDSDITEITDARDSRGRTLVEKVLHEDQPPYTISVFTNGIEPDYSPPE